MADCLFNFTRALGSWKPQLPFFKQQVSFKNPFIFQKIVDCSHHPLHNHLPSSHIPTIKPNLDVSKSHSFHKLTSEQCDQSAPFASYLKLIKMFFAQVPELCPSFSLKQHRTLKMTGLTVKHRLVTPFLPAFSHQLYLLSSMKSFSPNL